MRCVVLLGVAVTVLQPACQQNDAPAGDIVRDLGALLGVSLAGDEDPGPPNIPVGRAPGAVGKNKSGGKRSSCNRGKVESGHAFGHGPRATGYPEIYKD